MKFATTTDKATNQTDTEIRELCIEEIESVAGGAGGSNTYSSSQGGGNDGYGGSRRNP